MPDIIKMQETADEKARKEQEAIERETNRRLQAKELANMLTKEQEDKLRAMDNYINLQQEYNAIKRNPHNPSMPIPTIKSIQEEMFDPNKRVNKIKNFFETQAQRDEFEYKRVLENERLNMLKNNYSSTTKDFFSKKQALEDQIYNESRDAEIKDIFDQWDNVRLNVDSSAKPVNWDVWSNVGSQLSSTAGRTLKGLASTLDSSMQGYEMALRSLASPLTDESIEDIVDDSRNSDYWITKPMNWAGNEFNEISSNLNARSQTNLDDIGEAFKKGNFWDGIRQIGRATAETALGSTGEIGLSMSGIPGFTLNTIGVAEETARQAKADELGVNPLDIKEKTNGMEVIKRAPYGAVYTGLNKLEGSALAKGVTKSGFFSDAIKPLTTPAKSVPGKVAKGLTRNLARVGERATLGAGTEYIAEGGQSIAQQLASRKDPYNFKNVNWDKVLNQASKDAELGAVVGATIGGATTAIGGARSAYNSYNNANKQAEIEANLNSVIDDKGNIGEINNFEKFVDNLFGADTKNFGEYSKAQIDTIDKIKEAIREKFSSIDENTTKENINKMIDELASEFNIKDKESLKDMIIHNTLASKGEFSKEKAKELGASDNYLNLIDEYSNTTNTLNDYSNSLPEKFSTLSSDEKSKARAINKLLKEYKLGDLKKGINLTKLPSKDFKAFKSELDRLLPTNQAKSNENIYTTEDLDNIEEIDKNYIKSFKEHLKSGNIKDNETKARIYDKIATKYEKVINNLLDNNYKDVANAKADELRDLKGLIRSTTDVKDFIDALNRVGSKHQFNAMAKYKAKNVAEAKKIIGAIYKDEPKMKEMLIRGVNIYSQAMRNSKNSKFFDGGFVTNRQGKEVEVDSILGIFKDVMDGNPLINYKRDNLENLYKIKANQLNKGIIFKNGKEEPLAKGSKLEQTIKLEKWFLANLLKMDDLIKDSDTNFRSNKDIKETPNEYTKETPKEEVKETKSEIKQDNIKKESQEENNHREMNNERYERLFNFTSKFPNLVNHLVYKKPIEIYNMVAKLSKKLQDNNIDLDSAFEAMNKINKKDLTYKDLVTFINENVFPKARKENSESKENTQSQKESETKEEIKETKSNEPVKEVNLNEKKESDITESSNIKDFKPIVETNSNNRASKLFNRIIEVVKDKQRALDVKIGSEVNNRNPLGKILKLTKDDILRMAVVDDNINLPYDSYLGFISKDENGNLDVNDAFLSAMQKALLILISKSSVMTPIKVRREQLEKFLGLGRDEFIETKDFNVLKDLMFRNVITADLVPAIISELGIKRKSKLTLKEKEEYNKLVNSLASFTIDLAIYKGAIEIIAKNDKKTGMLYNNIDKIVRKLRNIDENDDSFNLSIIKPSENLKAIFDSNKNSSKSIYKALGEYGLSETRDIIILKDNELPAKINFKQSKNFLYKITKKINESLNKLMRTPYRLNEKAFNKLREYMDDPKTKALVLKQVGYVDENSNEFNKLSYTSKESVRAKNETILDELDKILLRDDLNGMRLFFNIAFLINGRNRIDSNTINPQSSKIHRFLVLPESMIRNRFNINNTDEVTNAAKNIGMGLGYTFDKASTNTYIDNFNDEFKSRTNSDEDLIIIDRDNNTIKFNTEYIASDRFNKAIKGYEDYILNNEVEEFTLSLANFESLKAMHEAFKTNPNLSVLDEINFFGEIDGITNGTVFKNTLMPLFNISKPETYEAYKDLEAKGGVFFNSDYKSVGEYFESGNQDIYKTGALKFEDKLKKAPDNFQKAFEYLMGKFTDKSGKVTKDGRNFFKSPVMVFSYGANIIGITNAIKTHITETFSNKMAEIKADLNNSNDLNRREINNLLVRARGYYKAYLIINGLPNSKIPNNKVLDKEVKEILSNISINDIIETMSNKKGNALNTLKYLKKQTLKSENNTEILNNVLSRTLDEFFPMAENTTQIINNVANTMFKMYENSIRKLQDDVKDSKIYDETNDIFKDGKFKDKSYEEALNELQRTFIPKVNVDNMITPIASRKTKRANNIDGSPMTYETKVKMHYKDEIPSYNKSNTVYSSQLGDPKKATPVFMVHPIDGYVMREVNENFDIAQIFDAFVTTQSNATPLAKRYNELFLNNTRELNPLENLSKDFEKALEFYEDFTGIKHENLSEKQISITERIKRRKVNRESAKSSYYILLDELKGNAKDLAFSLDQITKLVNENREFIKKSNSNITIDQMAGAKPYNFNEKESKKSKKTTTNEVKEQSKIDTKFTPQPSKPNELKIIEVKDNKDRLEIDRKMNSDTINANTEYIVSGGDNGVDYVAGKMASVLGIKVNHFYTGEKSKYNAPNGNYEISQLDIDEGKSEVAKAAKRNYGYQDNTIKDKELIKNWSQVKYADAIIAIGEIAKKGDKLFPNKAEDTRKALNETIKGETGYAVSMAILHNKPVRVYDQTKNQWYEYSYKTNEFVKVTEGGLSSNPAIIGTKEINKDGLKALKNVFIKAKEKEVTFTKEKYNKVEFENKLDNIIDDYNKNNQTSEVVEYDSTSITETNTKTEEVIDNNQVNEENTKTNIDEKQDNKYEVSSKGDKRFSALYAKLKDGRTIEEAYQLDAKGYRSKGDNWKLGKEKKPLIDISKEDSYRKYKQLWIRYLYENPKLFKELVDIVNNQGKELVDSFAKTYIDQAKALTEIVKENPYGVIDKKDAEKYPLMYERKSEELPYSTWSTFDTKSNEQFEKEIDRFKLDNDTEVSERIYDRAKEIDEAQGIYVSKSHDKFLREQLKKIVDKAKKFIPEIEVVISEAQDIAINSGHFNINTKSLRLVKAKNVDNTASLSNRETYAHELFHALTVFGLTAGRRFLTKEIHLLSRIHKEFVKDLKVENLIPLGQENNPIAKKMALSMFKSLTGPQGLEELIAFGNTNEVVMNRLKSMKLNDRFEYSKDKKGIIGFINGFIDKILNFLYNKDNFKGVKYEDDLYSALEYVTMEIARVNNNLEAKNTMSNKIAEKIMNSLLDPLDEKVSQVLFNTNPFTKMKIANGYEIKPIGIKETGSRIKSLKNIFYNVILAVNDKQARQIWKDMLDETYPYMFGYGGTIQNWLDDIETPDALKRVVQNFQAVSSRIDAQRNAIKTTLANTLKENVGKEYSKAERSSLTRSILQTDLVGTNLNTKGIKELLRDSSKLKEAIQRKLEEVEYEASRAYPNYIYKKYSNLNKYLKTQADSLALFMNKGVSDNPNLAMNAYNIAKLFGSKDTNIELNSNNNLIRALDEYISLKAIELLDKGDKDFLLNEIETNPNGIEFLLNTIKLYKYEAENNHLKDSPFNAIKGYKQDIYDSSVSFKLAKKSDEDKMALNGYKPLITNYKGDPNRTLYYNTWSPIVSFNRTATRLLSNETRGTTIEDIAEIQDNLSYDEKQQFILNERDKIQSNIANSLDKLLIKGKVPFVNSDENMIATYDSEGRVKTARYMINNLDKELKLGINNDIFEVLGSMNVSMYDQRKTKEHNSEISKILIDDYKNAKSIDRKRYVEINANSKDKYIAQIYRKLPYDMKVELESYFGKGKIKVRKDMLQRVFGYSDMSITNSKLYNRLNNYTAKRSLQLAEEILKFISQIDKLKIVVKTPAVFIGNIVSNIMLCINLGVNPVNAFKLQLDAIKLLDKYRKDSIKLIELEHLAKTSDRYDRHIEVLKNNLKNSPIAPLIKAGLFTNIVEDLDKVEPTKVEKYLRSKSYDRLPKVAQGIFDNVFLTKNSKLFSGLYKFTQYADFTARYAVYITNKQKGMNEARNLEIIRDAFIDYDLPTSRLQKYMNDIGALYFLKYFTRIQRVILNNTADKPISTLLFLMPTLLFNFSTIYEASAPNKIFSGSWEHYFHNPSDFLASTGNLLIPDTIEILADKQFKNF